MAGVKLGQGKVTEAIDAARWAAHGDDGEAAVETRRRAKLCGPGAIAFLNLVMRRDDFASIPQRNRCANTLLEVGQFLAYEPKATGLFRAESSDGSGEGEAH
jgi:hypothetical protein